MDADFVKALQAQALTCVFFSIMDEEAWGLTVTS